MVWVLLFIVAFIFLAFVQANSNMNNFEKKYGVKTMNLINTGTYVSGHPYLDKPFKNSSLLFEENEVKIFEQSINNTGFDLKSIIQKKSINNVLIEDASTIQNRVTVGRLLLTGIFAFAWKKKEKQECAYLIIEWDSNQFKNETIFEFEGKGSIEKANTVRNKFIKYLSSVDNSNNDDIKEIQASIPLSENEKYIDLIKKGRKVEAVNLYIYNNKCKISEAQDYIESLE